MFSLQHIQRQFTAGQFDLLLKSVSHNGLQLPQELQDHLLGHPVCAAGLALKRAMEVSYGRLDAITGQMVAFLLDSQETDGSFGFAPLPTACGMIALGSVLQSAPIGSLPASRPQALQQAHDAARKALTAMIVEEAAHGLPTCRPGKADLMLHSQTMDWAFVLLLLSEDLTFAPGKATDQLHQWFATHQRQLPDAISRIWHRTGWTPAPGSAPAPGSPGSCPSHHGRDQAVSDKTYGPTHGRFHQSPRGNLRRSSQPSRFYAA